ncbi:hypothetical protein [Falsibacillus albus]|uniref:PqqD family protein n=1 Tax=Falsibacillus albus TaxID=2478915 RepID=A0A3L7JU80_9BACI|nr:hypothetical protein [Falsibacillus albus]RLQ93845.1 hypothetical protein D9X91_16380 [Falsibacillus albus]
MNKELTLDSIVEADHLAIQPEGDEYTVGDPAINVFIRIPEEGVEVIRRLNGEESLSVVQDRLLNEKGLEVDVLDFVSTLMELNLVAKIDGEQIVESTMVQQGLEKKVGELLFSRAAIILYAACIGTAVIFLCLHPHEIPKYRDAFVFDSIGISLLFFFIISWVLTIIHEVGHYLAASKEGVPVRFNLSIRWFWLVVEADMNGLWGKPKKQRYVPLLAGLFWDAVILCIGLLLQSFLPEGAFSVQVCKMIVLIQSYKILWQFIIFVRTDLYYVMITYLNSADLTRNSIAYLFKPFSKKYKAFFEELPMTDRKTAMGYGSLYAPAFLAAVYIYTMYSIPGAIYALKMAMGQVMENRLASGAFWDGMIPLVIALLEMVLWGVGVYNTYFRKENTNVEFQNS